MNDVNRLEKELAHTIGRLYQRGFVSGVGGNTSALLSSGKDILITPAGCFKGGVAEGDLMKASSRGRVISKRQLSSGLAARLKA